MLHLKKRLSTAGLMAFSVFYPTAVLVLLAHCCGGQSRVVGPLQPVIVTIGDDATLPCHLEPAEDAAARTFEWARPDLNPRFVHVWHGGQDLHVNQHPSYKGRTSLSVNKLQHGDVSLTLSAVKLSDEGSYRCYFPDSDTDSTVQLVVGTASSPSISLSGMDRDKGGVVLHCGSAGWYPEPEVLWLDGEGNLLPAGPPETVRGPDDLYTVSSTVTVEKRPSSSFTCRVHQKTSNQTRETHITVPEDFFVAPCRSAAWVTVSLLACFTCILTVLFSLWRWRRNKTKTMKASQRETQQLMAESQKRDTEKKMSEMSEQTEHEDMVAVLREQVEALKKQRDELKGQKEKMENLVKDTEMKLQSVEKELTEKDEDRRINSAAGCTKLKEIISLYKWGLNDRQKELQQLEQDTLVLLEKTEKVMMTADRKEEARHEDT